MKEEKEDGTTIAIGCFVMLVLFVPAILWRGLIFAQLWAWFAVPLGLPAIKLWHAYGVLLLVGFAATTSFKSDTPNKPMMTHVTEMIIVGFIGPALALLSGWAVHQLM